MMFSSTLDVEAQNKTPFPTPPAMLLQLLSLLPATGLCAILALLYVRVHRNPKRPACRLPLHVYLHHKRQVSGDG